MRRFSFFAFLFLMTTLLWSCNNNNESNDVSSPSADRSKAPDDPGSTGASDDPDHPVLLNDEIEKNHPDVQPIDLKRAYSFRDEFLKNSKLGSKYIDYHYKIAEYPNEAVIILNNFNDCYHFAIELYKIADRLESGADSTIVFNGEFYNEAMNIMALYRDEPTLDPSIHAVLDSIESDLNKFVNKDRGYIIGEMNR